jgi:hypothetical protein
MGWLILQSLIIFAVMAANLRWQLANNITAGVIGVFLAAVVTWRTKKPADHSDFWLSDDAIRKGRAFDAKLDKAAELAGVDDFARKLVRADIETAKELRRLLSECYGPWLFRALEKHLIEGGMGSAIRSDALASPP